MRTWISKRILAVATAAAFAAVPVLAQTQPAPKPQAVQPAAAPQQAPAVVQAAPLAGPKTAPKTGYGNKICKPACTNAMYCDGDTGTCKN